MSILINTINNIEGLYKVKGCTDEQILIAQESLNLSFADDYKEYLREFGAISFNSSELTGLNVGEYLNVVDITKGERELNQMFPRKCIVIENTGVDGLLILQNQKGEIYKWEAFCKLDKIFDSFNDYILSLT